MTSRPPLTPLRMLFAIIGGLIITVGGGCTLIFAMPALAYGAWLAVLLYGGVPIAVGSSILWFAVRWRRGDDVGGQGKTND